ncbi:MAG: hypothetical protein AAFV01_14970, partial [Bacteroidota bacterium]
HPFNADPASRVGLVGLVRDEDLAQGNLVVSVLTASALAAFAGWRFRQAGSQPPLPFVASILLVLSVVFVPIFSYDFVAGSALLILSRFWKQIWVRALVVLALIGSSKPNAVETHIARPDLPVIGVLDGWALQLTVVGSLLFVTAILCLAVRREGRQAPTND